MKVMKLINTQLIKTKHLCRRSASLNVSTISEMHRRRRRRPASIFACFTGRY